MVYEQMWEWVKTSGVLDFLLKMGMGTAALLVLLIIVCLTDEVWWRTPFAKPVAKILEWPFAVLENAERTGPKLYSLLVAVMIITSPLVLTFFIGHGIWEVITYI